MMQRSEGLTEAAKDGEDEWDLSHGGEVGLDGEEHTLEGYSCELCSSGARKGNVWLVHSLCCVKVISYERGLWSCVEEIKRNMKSQGASQTNNDIFSLISLCCGGCPVY